MKVLTGIIMLENLYSEVVINCIIFQLPILFHDEEYNEEKAAKLDEALGWLNTFLDGRAFVAGDDLTIADISIIVTITNLDVSSSWFLSYCDPHIPAQIYIPNHGQNFPKI